MRKRFLHRISVLALGCSFQFLGCESEQISEILAAGIRSTAVEVGTLVIESAVDQALGLD